MSETLMVRWELFSSNHKHVGILYYQKYSIMPSVLFGPCPRVNFRSLGRRQLISPPWKNGSPSSVDVITNGRVPIITVLT